MTGNKKFVLGLSNKYNEYIIYYINRDEDSRLIYLRRYDDKNLAMDDLVRYSLIGTSDAIGNEVLVRMQLYINNEINTHEFIRSIFSIFKYNETPGFQECINLVDNIEVTENILIYKNQLYHLATCIYPEIKEIGMYLSLYNIAETIYSSFNPNTLYDPSNNLVSSLIDQIMSIFEYTPNEDWLLVP